MGVERTNDRVIVEASDQATNPGPSGGSSLPGQTGEPLQKFAMVTGDGEESYGKNSNLQASIMNKLPQLVLYEALERVTLPSEGDAMILADLGSSSGPNTVSNVVLMVEKLEHRLQDDTEFQICFNDLPSNDFNTLSQHITNDPRAKNLFASGVPGSYFGRLFPHSSVHVFYSANCLHWLSEIPNAALDKDSAYGRGEPWAWQSHSYQLQASLDLRNFLVARGAELVSGGLLFMVFDGRSAPEPNNPMENILDKVLVDLSEIWSDLVAEGLLTVQQQDTLNIPEYDRVIEDVREVMACCAYLFSVLTTKLHRFDRSAMELFATSEPATLSTKMMGMHKAVLNYLFEAHVGKKVSEVTWQQYEKLIEKRAIMSPQDLRISNSVWIVSLIRK